MCCPCGVRGHDQRAVRRMRAKRFHYLCRGKAYPSQPVRRGLHVKDAATGHAQALKNGGEVHDFAGTVDTRRQDSDDSTDSSSSIGIAMSSMLDISAICSAVNCGPDV